jgi:hypothetical protein
MKEEKKDVYDAGSFQVCPIVAIPHPLSHIPECIPDLFTTSPSTV